MGPQLHVVFFPFMAHGHMIPTLDIAKLFTARDVKATIITTPLNVNTFTKAIGKSAIDLEVIRFPAREAGLPEGIENLEEAMTTDFLQKFFDAAEMMREQLEQLLEKNRPHCIVADMFFPWASESAAKFNIPRLVFHGYGFLPLCVQEIERLYKPFNNVSSDEDLILLPRLPHEIKLRRRQVSEEKWTDDDNEHNILEDRIKESEVKSYGVIVNSFYELEPEYADFFTKELGRKAWSIGPVSLCNRSSHDKAQRGKQASIDEHECLKWLNSKKTASVVYICFGSLAHSLAAQLHEIAIALEHSEQNFIWVVRNADSDEWLPQGFKERVEGKGLIIRGWAPQILILEHEAVGAFVTHCGWNSTLEGISAGVPMVTWPIFAEQFYNEKLVTQILRIGIPVGDTIWCIVPSIEDVIKRDDIEKAVREIMEGTKVGEMRQRAKQLKELALRAVDEGGSSHHDLTALINDLRAYNGLIQN